MLKYSESNLDRKRDLIKAHEANVRAKKAATKRKLDAMASASGISGCQLLPPVPQSDFNIEGKLSKAEAGQDRKGVRYFKFSFKSNYSVCNEPLVLVLCSFCCSEYFSILVF